MGNRSIAGRALAAACALVVAMSGAAAQDGAAATAEALFIEGRRLMEQEQWSAAADKMRASDRADPSVGARLSLGDCLLELGKTASAWAAYREAANLARDRSDGRRARVASDRAAALEPQLTYVVVRVPPAARIEGLEILWDGAVQPSPLWGQRFPVDPGMHTLAARAEGHRGWNRQVSASEPGAEVAVEVPAPEPLPEPDEPEVPGGERPVGPADPAERPPESPWTTGRKAAVGVAAAGAVAVAVGSAFGLSARSKWNQAEDNCDAQRVCDAEGVRLAGDARSAGNVSTAAFLAGGGALAGAAILWFGAAPESPETDATALTPALGPEMAGLLVKGSF